MVSLLPSATDIICALGFEDRLVGRSHECDFPESVKRLPICTEAKLNLEGSSSEIDCRVKEVLADGLSIYRVREDVLKALRPDVIVTQSQCEVCAVSLQEVEEAVEAWLDSRPRIISLAPNNLADVWGDIYRVAQELGVPDRGQDAVKRLKERTKEIAEKARTVDRRPSMACIEWFEPLMAAGNWVPELVEMAGGANLFGEAGTHSSWMTWDALREGDPEVIVLMPCGFDLDRTRRGLPEVTRNPSWGELRAVRTSRVYLADGNQFFNRPGPRLAESLEILAEILHPDRFHFGHEGAGWERL